MFCFHKNCPFINQSIENLLNSIGRLCSSLHQCLFTMVTHPSSLLCTSMRNENEQLMLNDDHFYSLGKNKSKPVPEADVIPFLAQSPDCLDYFMQHERRGRCLIINNRCFDSPNLHERKGTEVDGRKLTSCFRQLHFDVTLIEDRKVKDIRNSINEIAMQDFSKDDCFICCVLTHGELNALWARDERYVLDLLLQPFRGTHCVSTITALINQSINL